MNELSSVDWSRAQFALTAIYHFLFVPLTLGLSFIIAIMETLYVKTGDVRWKKITQFWMSLFAINFAIGVATGLIMEFEFGTNWANYSWFVGDIFGAPLAIEGLLAFFMESTFFAVMFFGWNKVTPKFHLLSTWLVAIGSNLSAFWILVANGWMQYPIGMYFNPSTARNEMSNFFDVILSPVAISKFLHTVSSGYVIGALFVIGISSWFLLKQKEVLLAKRSIVVGATFGLLTSLFLTLSGDESAYQVAQHQPVKLAAMEGLYKGESRAGIIAFGILNPNKQLGDKEPELLGDIELPYMLSLLGHRDVDAFVPGLEDLVYGNPAHNITPASERIANGKIALQALSDFREAKKMGDAGKMKENEAILQTYMKDFGYGYFEKPEQIVPPIALSFYSFHIMVSLGMWFIALFALTLFFTLKRDIVRYPLLLNSALWSIPLGYIAAEAGWIVAEVGRQPWAIQDLMPTHIAATHLGGGNIALSFTLFAILFTVLLIAEIKIMLRQIAKGFEGGH
ncbi:cytochrome ubiquinol oxidase subunit I [Sulfurospirillum deleyianum]|uniref:Cytochrome bd ubiquinol oxidase subunit I n=1 Tax=Sulfurospirillum deleyianum (strain ATCC 51133 / DSM 6946 / 5175) TaxID=525898 RepID=D1B3S9_SULD5|nr:cytochrome ubiquinol oxidase subunit I [Sulfurospirillum deleyianum]ACZ12749.1 cytochrome bd ubiquinol oxidase subunit I [Sulfurospirillum deleyianum DSM 6946]